MFFITPSSKEQTMKRTATTLFAAVLLSLVVAAAASAHRSVRLHGATHSNPAARHFHMAHFGHHHLAA